MTERTTSNNNSALIIGILALLLTAAIVYSFMQNSKIEVTQKAFETEKALKIAELKKVQQEYDDFLQENQVNEEEIIETKVRLNRLLDSVQNIEPDYTLVQKLRAVRDDLKTKLEILQEENERLKEENYKLAIEKDSVLIEKKSVERELKSTLVVYKKIEKRNTKLNKIVAKAQKVSVGNITNKAIRIKKSGKVTATDRAKRVSSIEVCYEIPANALAVSGEKEFYIQVVSPSKKVIGGRFYMNDEKGNFVNISKISKFRYQKKMITVCDYVEPLPEEVFEAGEYSVHVFQGTTLISSSSILLK